MCVIGNTEWCDDLVLGACQVMLPPISLGNGQGSEKEEVDKIAIGISSITSANISCTYDCGFYEFNFRKAVFFHINKSQIFYYISDNRQVNSITM